MVHSISNISDSVVQFKETIEEFLSQLDIEKLYFKITYERILSWDFIIVVTCDNKIVALGGLEKKLFFFRNNLIIEKNQQGKGLGTKILLELMQAAQNKCSILLAVIKEENSASIRAHQKSDYKKLGRRQGLLYFARTWSIEGRLIFFLLRQLFPFLKILDRIRQEWKW